VEIALRRRSQAGRKNRSTNATNRVEEVEAEAAETDRPSVETDTRNHPKNATTEEGGHKTVIHLET